jgi:hypothetical protein
VSAFAILLDLSTDETFVRTCNVQRPVDDMINGHVPPQCPTGYCSTPSCQYCNAVWKGSDNSMGSLMNVSVTVSVIYFCLTGVICMCWDCIDDLGGPVEHACDLSRCQRVADRLGMKSVLGAWVEL